MALQTEKQVEKYLRHRVIRAGGICYKFVSPGRASVPDRICAMPMGVTAWVECKGENTTLRSQQRRELERLKNLKQLAVVVHSYDEVDQLFTLLEEETKWQNDLVAIKSGTYVKQ